MDNQFQKLSDDQQHQLLFMMLVQQHEQIGLMGLGKIKNPATDVIERDLNAAKYAIDTLAMLEKYTKGNIERELSSYLTQKLSMLRLNYVDEANHVSEKKSDPAPPVDESETA